MVKVEGTAVSFAEGAIPLLSKHPADVVPTAAKSAAAGVDAVTCSGDASVRRPVRAL